MMARLTAAALLVAAASALPFSPDHPITVSNNFAASNNSIPLRPGRSQHGHRRHDTVRPYDTVVHEIPRQWFTHVIGGAPVSPTHKYEFLSQVVSNGLSYSEGAFCGASLIAPGWVLTAAHCTEGESAADISVLVNWHNLGKQTDKPGEVHRVSQIIDHPSYDWRDMSNDFSLLKLATRSKHKAIELDDGASSLPGASQTVAGWGNTGSSYPSTPMQVDVPIVSNDVCNSKASYNGQITASMICAGLPEGKYDACQGDSGGPLFSSEKGAPKLTGVVSWGEGCAQRGKYGVYGRVSHALKWIKRHIGADADATIV